MEGLNPAGLTLKKWTRVAAFVGITNRVITAWLTSTEWEALAKDVRAEALDQGVTTPLTHSNFGKEVKLGNNLTLRNSGTEDQDTVNAMNWVTFGDMFPEFDWKRRNWQTGNKFVPHDLNLPDKPFD